MQKWSKAFPVKQITQKQAETAWNRLNQFTPDPEAPSPFNAAPARPGTRGLDATPVTELVRTEWFTSLVNSGVRACATFQVDLGPIHFDTKRQCVDAADIAAAYAWLVGGMVGVAEANGTQVKGLSKSSIDNLITALTTARSSSSVAP